VSALQRRSKKGSIRNFSPVEVIGEAGRSALESMYRAERGLSPESGKAHNGRLWLI
jgi:hypothetical protein